MSEIQKLLLERINSNKALINDWFEEKFSRNKPLFYNSVDLRHSGYKIAPIDNNCFPAGFNNLGIESKKLAKELANNFFSANHPGLKKILIIPENHTRNMRYLQNVLALKNILEIDGKIEVQIGSLISDLEDNLVINTDEQAQGENTKITLNKLLRKDDKIVTKSGFVADLIISNNDFTHQPEEILQNISQNILPPTKIGWHQRTKSEHFNIYQNLSNDLGKLINIDPWLISSIHKSYSGIDFKSKENTENLANIVDQVINEVKEKYLQHGIKDEPYCYIKADSGTYGMGIMTVKNIDEILNINKKQRNKMNVTKGNVVNHQVIIQEGVPTDDKINKIIAEPMIYMINGKVVGNLARINDHKDREGNLNSEGMKFADIADIDDANLEIGGAKAEIFKVYELIGRLSALSAAKESSLKN